MRQGSRALLSKVQRNAVDLSSGGPGSFSLGSLKNTKSQPDDSSPDKMYYHDADEARRWARRTG